MAEKLGVKRKHIYRLHRSNTLDHIYGRPAILLNGRVTKSLVWTGTTKLDEKNREKPLTLNLNGIPVYFYGNAIEPVQTKDLIKEWTNKKTKSPYTLQPEDQKAVLKKFISMSELEDPYLKIDELEKTLKNKDIKTEDIEKNDKNKNLEVENEFLKQENQNLKIEQEQLKLENETLKTENQMLKSRTKTKVMQDFEQE